MLKNLVFLLILCICAFTIKAQWYYGNQEAVNLENTIGFNKHGQKIITGLATDPTTASVTGAAGTILLRTTGELYLKKDNGNTINWEKVLDQNEIDILLQGVTSDYISRIATATATERAKTTLDIATATGALKTEISSDYISRIATATSSLKTEISSDYISRIATATATERAKTTLDIATATGALTLRKLSDVDDSAVATGSVVSWDGTKNVYSVPSVNGKALNATSPIAVTQDANTATFSLNTTTAPSTGNVLTYDGSKWDASAPSGKSLNALSPVSITQDANSATFTFGTSSTPSNGDFMVYDGVKWDARTATNSDYWFIARNATSTVVDTTTDIPFNLVSSNGITWDGNSFVVPKTGHYQIDGMVAFTDATTANILLFSNGVDLQMRSSLSTSTTEKPFNYGYRFNEGDVISIRSSASATIAATAYHFIAVKYVPPFSDFNNSAQHFSSTTTTTVAAGDSGNYSYKFTASETTPSILFDFVTMTATVTGYPSGTVAYWNMDGATGSNEINQFNAGTWDLVQVGSSPSVSGKLATAKNFTTGYTDYYYVSGASEDYGPFYSENFVVGCWYKLGDTSNLNRAIISKTTRLDSNGWELFSGWSANWDGGIAVGGTYAYRTFGSRDTNWHLAIGHRNTTQNTLHYYYDAVRQNDAASAGTLYTTGWSNVLLGSYNPYFGGNGSHALDDCFFISGEYTTSQIQTLATRLYNAGTGRLFNAEYENPNGQKTQFTLKKKAVLNVKQVRQGAAKNDKLQAKRNNVIVDYSAPNPITGTMTASYSLYGNQGDVFEFGGSRYSQERDYIMINAQGVQ